MQLKLPTCTVVRLCSFGVICIRISDPRSLGSWCIRGTDESTLVMCMYMYSLVLLMNYMTLYDLSDLGALILIPSKEYILMLYCL